VKRLEGEHTLLRIFVGEADRYDAQPLYRAIVQRLRKERIAGVTVLKGVMGYGANSVLHSANLLRLSESLPMVIEVVDSRDNIDRVLPMLDEMIKEGLVTLERVAVLRYEPKDRAPQ
jgi:PII-like signaling protein